MITRIHPDKQKSKSLRKMAEITLERLKETDTEKYPTNCYCVKSPLDSL